MGRQFRLYLNAWESELGPICAARTSGAEAIQHRVLIHVHLAFRLQQENGSNIAALAATLLSPAIPLTAPGSDPLTGPEPLTNRVPRSDPSSRPRGLAG